MSNVARSWVYFIQAGENGPIKIGFTGGNPAARLNALQTGNHEPLRLLVATPGTLVDEQALHTRFANLRTVGEWFRASAELVHFVAGVQWVRRQEVYSVEDEPTMLGLSRAQLEAIRGYLQANEWVERYHTFSASVQDIVANVTARREAIWLFTVGVDIAKTSAKTEPDYEWEEGHWFADVDIRSGVDHLCRLLREAGHPPPPEMWALMEDAR